MGFIGKFMVLLHGALAIAVLTWAAGVYTQRIHWNAPPPKEGKEAALGIFDKQKAAADQFNTMTDKAYTRWSGNLNQVALLEAERYPRRAYYQGQLELVESGSLTAGGMAVAEPVQELENAPNGYLDIRRPTGRKAFEVRPGVAADSINGYVAKRVKLVEDIKASQDRNELAIKDREKLNREIVGVTLPAVVKGLRTLLLEQKTIYDRANGEDMYVVNFVTNQESEFGLLRKRRDAMNGRSTELIDFYRKNPAVIPPGVVLPKTKQ
ncbi:MAG: hypothetical protein EXS09_13105 [Gemmataceae bacterium]|nr:hypothetical protein [Gemmataceae bacterium]